MNPLALIIAAARSGAHKSGIVSAAEAIPGGLVAYVAVHPGFSCSRRRRSASLTSCRAIASTSLSM